MDGFMDKLNNENGTHVHNRWGLRRWSPRYKKRFMRTESRRVYHLPDQHMHAYGCLLMQMLYLFSKSHSWLRSHVFFSDLRHLNGRKKGFCGIGWVKKRVCKGTGCPKTPGVEKNRKKKCLKSMCFQQEAHFIMWPRELHKKVVTKPHQALGRTACLIRDRD